MTIVDCVPTDAQPASDADDGSDLDSPRAAQAFRAAYDVRLAQLLELARLVSAAHLELGRYRITGVVLTELPTVRAMRAFVDTLEG